MKVIYQWSVASAALMLTMQYGMAVEDPGGAQKYQNNRLEAEAKAKQDQSARRASADLPKGRIEGGDANNLVNVREGPGKNYDKVVAVRRGEPVELVGGVTYNGKDGWLPVRVGKYQGWVNEKYYKPAPSTALNTGR
jgi:hypothetical protein